jgi:hypothetical protein
LQGVLKPLHDILIAYLRSLRTDCTYHQEKIFAWHKSIIDAGKTDIYSLDLTAATDRLPLGLQACIIQLVLSGFSTTSSKVLAETWEILIKSISFSIRIKGKLKFVSYSVGQGIGLYRSWPMMALTNHVVIRYAAYLVGIPKFRDYLVLGDDVVIADKEVALKYRDLIETMGVRISIHKSIVPSKLVGLEFASKLVNKEGNLSPLPVILITKSGLVAKLSFLSILADRILTEGIQRGPSLITLLVAIFGKRLREPLGEV